MFRYHEGFRDIARWTKSGLLGDVFSVRAHMSTWLTVPGREVISRHVGGIFYDLAGHMLDQVVWLLGRPHRIHRVFHNDATPTIPPFSDNTLGTFEFASAIAFVDISALETRPMPRRFEVYGTRGSAVMEPFEPELTLRLWLDEARAGFQAGVQVVPMADQPRQVQYERELAAFVAVLRGERAPDRSLDHELLVQETLLRTTGGIPGG
jgi:predicted dehydrogenase